MSAKIFIEEINEKIELLTSQQEILTSEQKIITDQIDQLANLKTEIVRSSGILEADEVKREKGKKEKLKKFGEQNPNKPFSIRQLVNHTGVARGSMHFCLTNIQGWTKELRGWTYHPPKLSAEALEGAAVLNFENRVNAINRALDKEEEG